MLLCSKSRIGSSFYYKVSESLSKKREIESYTLSKLSWLDCKRSKAGMHWTGDGSN